VLPKKDGKDMKRLAVLLFLVWAFCAKSGAQNYAPAVNYGTQVQPLGIVTGDFNGDGNPDLIVTSCWMIYISVSSD
jgi:hypothetical protein